MLTLRDTFTLAWTKLRSRKLWTSLFLTLEILLFAAVLVFTAGVRGFTESLEAFNSQGLNGKYLVTAANVRSNPDLETDPDVMNLAEQLYQAALTEHQALAEQLAGASGETGAATRRALEQPHAARRQRLIWSLYPWAGGISLGNY